MANTSLDARFMRRALRLAERAHGRTAPNPMVGAVVVKGGRVLAEGFHERAGQPHAEVVALSHLAANEARGATVYVSLEPCSHHGRTGPCAEALVAAGVARVVCAMVDQNPLVAGRGIERLRSAGVAVEAGLLEAAARAQNAGFVKWIGQRRPLVTLKAALSLDGRMAVATGDSRWVTREAARLDAHRLRDESDAILVGAGTVRADDPQLTTRLPPDSERPPRDAIAVVLDGRLAIAPEARVVRPGTLIATSDDADRLRAARLVERGAEVVRLPTTDGRVSLAALLDELGRRGLLELLVEGGAAVHGAFLAERLADRVVAYLAPKVVGADGVPFAAMASPRTMGEAIALERVTVRRLGEDVRVTGWLPRPQPP